MQRTESLERKLKSIDEQNLDSDELKILSYLYSKQRIKSNDAEVVLDRGRTHSRKILKKLEDKGLIKWIGTSKQDPTQYYRINF